MTRKDFPGGWYCDARPNGAYAVINTRDFAVETHAERLTPPDRLLYVRLSSDGTQLVGVGHGADSPTYKDQALLGDLDNHWDVVGKVCGPSGVIFDANDVVVRTADCADVGTNGYRYATSAGLVTGDATYSPKHGIDLFEWTDLGHGYRVGQGPDDNGAWFYDGAAYYEVIAGNAKCVRAHLVGDTVSIACYLAVNGQPPDAAIVWATIDEIRATFPAKATPRLTETPPPPVPVPVPPVSEVPVSAISGSEITAIVAESKAEVEALGHVFKTPAQVEALGFDADDRARALLVTLRAAWKLAQKYPSAGIGLESYLGPSGEPSPFVEDGPECYSFDIILLSKSGPSVDILGAGVTPTAQIDDTTDPQAPFNWRRDWRPPLNPYRGTSPAPVPTPLPEPAPLPTPGNTPVTCNCDLAPVLAQLDAIDAKLTAIVDAIARLDVSEFPVYTGEIHLGFMGTKRLRLEPES